jgi:hypothetical protein
VFARVNADALRLLRVPPDILPDTKVADQITIPLRGGRS